MNEDIEIWNAFKRGDQKAYEKIFKKHYAFLLNYGLRLWNNEEEIKDCIQILMSGLWISRTRLGDTNNIKNYLFTSIRRLILKRQKITINYFNIEEVPFHIELSHESKIIKDQEEAAKINQIKKAIENLPERQKEALYLKFYGDQSFAEIADTMNITTRAVYKLIYKALDQLGKESQLRSRHFSQLLSLFF